MDDEVDLSGYLTTVTITADEEIQVEVDSWDLEWVKEGTWLKTAIITSPDKVLELTIRASRPESEELHSFTVEYGNNHSKSATQRFHLETNVFQVLAYKNDVKVFILK